MLTFQVEAGEAASDQGKFNEKAFKALQEHHLSCLREMQDLPVVTMMPMIIILTRMLTSQKLLRMSPQDIFSAVDMSSRKCSVQTSMRSSSKGI